MEDLIKIMKELNIYLDFIIIDGLEGGLGVMYKLMVDCMGLLFILVLFIFIDIVNYYGVCNKFKVFVLGKLIILDKVVIVLVIGVDVVSLVCGFMMVSGCIMVF